MLRHSLYVAAILSAFSVNAREVSIALETTQTSLILVNPSTVTVTYNIICHKSDGSGTTVNLTGQTLAPNVRTTHSVSTPDSELCNSGAAPAYTTVDASSKKIYYCSGSNTYANANNACGAGNSFCFPNVSTVVSSGTGTNFWIKNEGDIQYQPMCGSYGAPSAGEQVIVGNGSYFGIVKKSSAVTAPCSYFANANTQPDSNVAGSVCCSSPEPGSVCKITISGSNTNAFLSSPSFLGGAAF